MVFVFSCEQSWLKTGDLLEPGKINIVTGMKSVWTYACV